MFWFCGLVSGIFTVGLAKIFASNMYTPFMMP